MAITQTGSNLDFPVTNSAATGTVSSTITVPADAQFVVVGVSSFQGSANGHTSMTFTKGGTDTAMTRVAGGDASTSNWQCAMFWQAVPDTGTNKSLKWAWAGTSADPTKLFSVTFWKGVDIASPVRDSDGAQGSGWPRNPPELTALTGDKIVAFTGYYYGGGGGAGDVTAWNNLTELAETTHNGQTEGAWAAGDPVGNTTVGVQSCTGSEGGVCALVIKPAAGSYTLTATVGALALTGVAANLSLPVAVDTISLVKYHLFIDEIAVGGHNLKTAVFKLALTNTAPTVASDTVWNTTVAPAPAAANGYTSGGNTLTTSSATTTAGVFKLVLADSVFTATAGGIGPFRYAILYNTSAANKLVGYYDYGSSLTLANTETFTADFDPSLGGLTIT